LTFRPHGFSINYITSRQRKGGTVSARFTDRELDLMNVLWQRGPSTVSEVRAALGGELAYTTVLTVLRVLEAKGHVGHADEGRAHRYFAKVEEQAARRGALTRLLDRAFGGSAELLLTQLVEDRNLSDEEIRRLRALMQRQLGKGKKR
jgi:predicted transcriptional regulator